MTFLLENIFGFILILLSGWAAFIFQKKYFFQNEDTLNGLSITTFKYHNVLFSWILAGLWICIYLFSGLFESLLAQNWRIELSPIVVLSAAFLIGPFYGFLVAIFGNIISMFLTPHVSVSSIQLLLTWTRGLTAFLPLITLIIFSNLARRQLTHRIFIWIMFLVIFVAWPLNLTVLILSRTITTITNWKISIYTIAFISAIIIVWGFNLLFTKVFRKKQSGRRARLAKVRQRRYSLPHVGSDCDFKANICQSKSNIKNHYQNARYLKREWNKLIFFSTISTMTFFYIVVYYLGSGLIIGVQILKIHYFIYILWYTPSWLLSCLIGIFVLYYVLINVSRSKRYDFILTKMKTRFKLQMCNQKWSR